METLAYLQVAEDYENPEGKEIVFLKDSLAALRSFNGLKLSSQPLFILLGVACSAFVLNIANAAQAAVFRGDSGPDVTNVQILLNDNGYSVPVTGYFGSQTENQVINFQSDVGLVADGVVGSATLSALDGFVPLRPGDRVSGVLRFGDSGSAVTDLQYLLSDNGYFSGPFTGYFGSSTEQAVINFQAAVGISADGLAGPETLAALQGGGFVPVNPGDGGGSGVYRLGDQGPAVSNIQNLLNDQGYPVSVTGYFGTVTEQQVRNFQYDNYLTADGVAGPATLDALNGGFVGVRPPGGGVVYQLGDSGVGVQTIQKFLSDRGYDSGLIDGVFGTSTYNAVIAYQRDIGVTQDGIWGPQTAAGLL